MDFDPSKPFRACLICGDVFQSWTDRLESPTIREINSAYGKREVWAKCHALRHTSREHLMLRQSGLTMTPEAANKLAAFGLLPISNMAKFDDEMSSALFESRPVPEKDSES